MRPGLVPILFAAFNPKRLFQGGVAGAWYDPADLSTLFQDSAGTTPVTANNDPVGLIRDKSGNGFHASQATAGLRPLYKTSGGLHWLEADGVDDRLALASNPLTGAAVATAIYAAKRTDNPPAAHIGAILAQFGSGVSDDLEPWIDGLLYHGFGGTTRGNFASMAAAATTPYLLRFERGPANLAITLNRATSLGSAALTVGWGASPGLFGSGAVFYEGRFYGGVLVASALSTSVIAKAEAHFGRKAGI